MFELRDIEVFVVVAHELSFRRAAERLHLSQPSVSQRIQHLERALGASLLRRDNRSVELTAAGRVLLERSAGFLDEAADLAAAVRLEADGDGSHIHLGYTTLSGADAVMRVISALRDQLPGVRVIPRTMSNGQVLHALRAHRIDVGLVWRYHRSDDESRDTPTWLCSIDVEHAPIGVLLAADHDLAGDGDLLVHQLRSERFISFQSHRGSALRMALNDLAHQAGFTPEIVQEVPDASALRLMVASGAGVAILPRPHSDELPAGCVFRSLADSVAEVRHHCVWRVGEQRRVVSELATHLVAGRRPEGSADTRNNR